MPSMWHEALLLLFRDRPSLAPELLRDALGVALPAWSEARLESSELTEVVPTEYRADLVVLLLDGRPVFAIVLEVQLRPDPAKRATWPLYLASLHGRVACPTALLVITPKPSVARWAAQPIDLGHPGFVLRPLVLGPDALPAITDPARAEAEPELGVLSAMAHGRRRNALAVALAALGGARRLDDERARLYADLVMMALPAAARAALERLMNSGTYEYQSEFARRYVAKGEQVGERRGVRKGVRAGEAGALLEVLKARGLALTPTDRARIRACTDRRTLHAWLRRAAVAGSVSEVFGPARRRRR